MDLGLRRLRMLREIADHGGVTAAAEAMHYSPSGVSQQMTALQDEIGAPVLERHGRGVRLTEVGRVLLEHSQILLNAEREAQSAIEQARDSLAVELTVGVFCTVAAGLVPAIINDLHVRQPEIRVRTREIAPDDAAVELRHGHLDLAFLIDYPDAAEPWPDDIALVTTAVDKVHLAAPAGQFSEHVVRLADLADEEWVLSGPHTYYGRAVLAACRQAGFEPRIVHQVDEQSTALAMVAAGLGLTLMSDLGRPYLPAHGVDVLDLHQPLHRQILVAYEAASRGRPAIGVFLDSAARAASATGSAPARKTARTSKVRRAT